MAHRGFSRDGLENSMAAFRAAVELGFRHLETDVHTTADGVLLLFHDETLDRVTDGRGRISELPAETVARARIGGAEPIPLFEELAAAFPDVRFNLDVKDWNSVDTLAAASSSNSGIGSAPPILARATASAGSSEILPRPSVIRSRVSSWNSSRTPSAVVCTSVSRCLKPSSTAARNAAMEFSRPSREKPRWAMATGSSGPSPAEPEAKNGCGVLTPEA